MRPEQYEVLKEQVKKNTNSQKEVKEKNSQEEEMKFNWTFEDMSNDKNLF